MSHYLKYLKICPGLARPTFYRSCSLICSDKEGPINIHHLPSNANNCVSFRGSSSPPLTQLRNTRRFPYSLSSRKISQSQLWALRACSYPTRIVIVIVNS